MRYRTLTGALAIASAAVAIGVSAQVSLPRIVQLPDDDFIFTWGDASPDNRDRTHFRIEGREQQFFCRLSGRFRANSRMSDFYNLRGFEQELIGTPYFIQDATRRMNEFDRSFELDWAVLECTVPDFTEDEQKTQERVDKALERALRDRERRRERDD